MSRSWPPGSLGGVRRRGARRRGALPDRRSPGARMGGRARPVPPLRTSAPDPYGFGPRRVCPDRHVQPPSPRRAARWASSSRSRRAGTGPAPSGRERRTHASGSAALSPRREGSTPGERWRSAPAGRRLAERLAYRPREVVVVALLAGGRVRRPRGRAVAQPPPARSPSSSRRSRPRPATTCRRRPRGARPRSRSVAGSPRGNRVHARTSAGWPRALRRRGSI